MKGDRGLAEGTVRPSASLSIQPCLTTNCAMLISQAVMVWQLMMIFFSTYQLRVS
jgi:hypothetical protein